MMPRRFFFGLIEVPFWEFRSGLTVAQIELLSADVPIVVYKADKDNDKPWKNGTATEGYAKSQYQRWLEKKKKREAEGKDLNKMFQNGRKIDFDKLLNTGEEKPLK